jgi:Flp pilus assembly protein TadB
LTKYLAIAAGVSILLLLAAVGFLYWQGIKRDQRIGALETSNEQLTKAINAKTQATQTRANAERDVRQLAPADKLDRLR